MANVQKGGFRYIGNMYTGLGSTPFIMRRELASGYGTAVTVGDPIKSVSDGTVAACDTNARPLGVVTGVSWVKNGKRVSDAPIPASTTFTPTAVGSANASWVYFIPAWPGMLFEVDADEGTTFTTLAGQIGALSENVEQNLGTSDATTGASGATIDISDHATTNTLPWRIIDYVKAGDNDPTVTRFKFIVTPNNSEIMGSSTTGATGV